MRAAKAWVAALVAILAAISAAIADSVITGDEYGTLASAIVVAVVGLIGALGVYQVKNKPDA